MRPSGRGWGSRGGPLLEERGACATSDSNQNFLQERLAGSMEAQELGGSLLLCSHAPGLHVPGLVWGYWDEGAGHPFNGGSGMSFPFGKEARKKRKQRKK